MSVRRHPPPHQRAAAISVLFAPAAHLPTMWPTYVWTDSCLAAANTETGLASCGRSITGRPLLLLRLRCTRSRFELQGDYNRLHRNDSLTLWLRTTARLPIFMFLYTLIKSSLLHSGAPVPCVKRVRFQIDDLIRSSPEKSKAYN